MRTSGHGFGRQVMAALAATTLAALAAGMAGCGGGDSNSNSAESEAVTEQPTAYPVEATLATLFTTENDLLYSAYVDPANREDYTFATHITPAAADHIVQFGGKGDMLVRVSYLTNTLARNGQKIWDSKATLLYTTSPLEWHGQIDDEGVYSVHTQVTPLPVTAPVGSRATWFTSIDYTNRDRTAIKQSTTVDYFLATSDVPGAAWLCLEFKVKEEATGALQNSTTCMKTNTTGSVLEVKRSGASVL